MLLHLYIRDLAIVSHVDINFHSGMTVITGETGAGKSILLDALNLALGERRDTQIVRPGAEKAEICATFDIAKLPGAVLWLADLELAGDNNQQCIIRRLIYANGRSKAFINGTPVTSQQLRILAEHLVQIHGQHQHQLLMKPQEQLRMLDAFGQLDALVSKVKAAYYDWEKIYQALEDLKQNNQEQAQIDLLNYQISEIDALNLQENELDNLHAEHTRLAHGQTTIEDLEKALNLLQNNEANVVDAIQQAVQIMRPLLTKFPLLKNAFECLKNADIQLQESIVEINHFCDSIEISPDRLRTVENRLEQIHQCARKHRVEATKLLAHFQVLYEKAKSFAVRDESIKRFTTELEIAQKRYHEVASTLTAARNKAKQKLEKEVSACIGELGMPGAVFKVELVSSQEGQLRPTGYESVIFNLSANPGHPPQPLSKVASGGELSRVSLALELSIAKYWSTPCLVFDEVDVGISGKTGSIVGKALYRLSQMAQVLCITHLPQVAAFGDNHIQVSKKRDKKDTQTQIVILGEDERIEEVARMLGGLDVTDQARAHARELLSNRVIPEST